MKKIIGLILLLILIVSMYFVYEKNQLNTSFFSQSPSSIRGINSLQEGLGSISSGAYALFLKDNMMLSGEGLSVISYKRVFGTSLISTGSDEYKRSLSGYNIYNIKSDLGITFQIDPFNTRLWYNEGWDDFSRNTIIVEQYDHKITAYESGNKDDLLIDIANIPFSGTVEDSIRNTIPKEMQSKCVVEKYDYSQVGDYHFFETFPIGSNIYEITADSGVSSICDIQMDDGCFDIYELCGSYAGKIDGATYLYSLNNKIFYQGLGQDTRRTIDYGPNIIE